MEGVRRGEIKRLLVLETLPKPINFTGGMDPLTYGGSFTLERILGTVPVEPDGSAHMVRGPSQTYNGHENKPAQIEQRIGRRPVFAAGNSNNDQPMRRYAVTGEHRGLALWIHHDDAAREYEYNQGTGDIKELCETNDSAHEVSIKSDWIQIFKNNPETN